MLGTMRPQRPKRFQQINAKDWLNLVVTFLYQLRYGSRITPREYAESQQLSYSLFEYYLKKDFKIAEQLVEDRISKVREIKRLSYYNEIESQRQEFLRRQNEAEITIPAPIPIKSRRGGRRVCVLSKNEWVDIVGDYLQRKCNSKETTIVKIANEYGVNKSTLSVKVSQLREAALDKLTQPAITPTTIINTQQPITEIPQVVVESPIQYIKPPVYTTPPVKTSVVKRRRVLFIGGKDFNIPKWMYHEFDVQQVPQDIGNRRASALIEAWRPDLIIVFRLYVTRHVVTHAMELANHWKIPCLHASSGVSSVIPLAERIPSVRWFVEAATKR